MAQVGIASRRAAELPIVAKGRKQTVGLPMQYDTSKDFLLEFGLIDLSEPPLIEDFEDLADSS